METELERVRRRQRHLDVLPGPATLGLPSGWFVAALSADLPRERTLTTHFMSEELLLYRTASGVVRATSPYCPHLGAHMGRSGTVVGELLRCDFHRFCFDERGACQETGSGVRPPPAARLAMLPVREQHGVILVHFDPGGAPPSWEVPELDCAGWSPLLFQKFRLRGHPQETTENSVDVGHFSAVHGYEEVRVIEEARAEGPRIFARYGMRRGLHPLTPLGVAFPTEFAVHVHGLGYSVVEVEVKSPAFKTRQFVLATPTDPGLIDLRIAVSVPEPASGEPAALPRRLLARALSRFVLALYAGDVRQDFAIWEHKRYVPRPALAPGEGRVGLYRRWARQFYGGSDERRQS